MLGSCVLNAWMLVRSALNVWMLVRSINLLTRAESVLLIFLCVQNPKCILCINFDFFLCLHISLFVLLYAYVSYL